MIRHRRSAKTCPDCQQPLVRVRRKPSERDAVDDASGLPMRRYRCVTLGCGWQGLLPRVPTPVALAPLPPVPDRRPPAPWAKVGGAVLAAAMLMLVTVQGTRHVLNASPDLAPSVARTWLPGEQHDGDLLPARHPWLRPVAMTAADAAPVAAAAASAPPSPATAAASGLALRRGCVWGKPGSNPYRGTVEQALMHARLPAEVVSEVARKVKAGQKSDRLEIRTGRIHGVQGGREFDPEHVVLSFGNTLCLNSRVNFEPGHVEAADLYEAIDNRGRRHAVMVPDVCGNVSVLGERGERRRAFGLLAASDVVDDEWRLLATGAAPDATAQVPEPGTLAVALAALFALWGVRHRRRAVVRPRTPG